MRWKAGFSTEIRLRQDSSMPRDLSVETMIRWRTYLFAWQSRQHLGFSVSAQKKKKSNHYNIYYGQYNSEKLWMMKKKKIMMMMMMMSLFLKPPPPHIGVLSPRD